MHSTLVQFNLHVGVYVACRDYWADVRGEVITMGGWDGFCLFFCFKSIFKKFIIFLFNFFFKINIFLIFLDNVVILKIIF